jgi:predicted DsbA family dithiol-disulfide isomerase
MSEHTVAVWSDYICPFCRLGQTRAEWMREQFGAEITWLSFDLHPEYPPEGQLRAEAYARFGDVSAMRERMKAQFEQHGLTYNPPEDIIPNTRLALQLTELARTRGLGEQLHDRLMDAYWNEGRNIGDADELRALAAEVGIDDPDVAWDDPVYLERVLASTAQAQSIGVTGVPGFLLDRRLLVLGAQPRELFEQAFEQLRNGE